MINAVCMDSYGNTIFYLTQWDSNQKLIIDSDNYNIDDSTPPVVQFWNQNMGEYTLGVQSVIYDGKIIADIPNKLLTEPYNIIAYLYLVKDESGKTIEKVKIPVRPRPRPDDVEYKDNVEAVYLCKIISDAESLRDDIEVLKNEFIDAENLSIVNEEIRISNENERIINEGIRQESSILCDEATKNANMATESATVITHDMRDYYERIKDADVTSLTETLENMMIGGRNIIKSTAFTSLDTSVYTARNSYATLSIDTINKHNNNNSLKIVANVSGVSSTDMLWLTMKPDRSGSYNVRVSFYAKSAENNNDFYIRWGYNTNYSKVTIGTDWQKYEIQLNAVVTDGNSLYPYFSNITTVWISELMIEYGTISTDWNPAPEDKADKNVATQETNGLMSAIDKDKLDRVEDGANKTVIANNLTTTEAGSALDAMQGKTLSDGISALDAGLSSMSTHESITLTVNMADLQAALDSLPKIINHQINITVNAGTINTRITITEFSGTGRLNITCHSLVNTYTHNVQDLYIFQNTLRTISIYGFTTTRIDGVNFSIYDNLGYVYLFACGSNTGVNTNTGNNGVYVSDNPGLTRLVQTFFSNKYITFNTDNSVLNIENPQGSNNYLIYRTSGGLLQIRSAGTITGTLMYSGAGTRAGGLIVKPDGSLA